MAGLSVGLHLGRPPANADESIDMEALIPKVYPQQAAQGSTWVDIIDVATGARVTIFGSPWQIRHIGERMMTAADEWDGAAAPTGLNSLAGDDRQVMINRLRAGIEKMQEAITELAAVSRS